jgi:hypothetical protein
MLKLKFKAPKNVGQTPTLNDHQRGSSQTALIGFPSPLEHRQMFLETAAPALCPVMTRSHVNPVTTI